MATAKQRLRVRSHKNRKKRYKLARNKNGGGIQSKDDGTIIEIRKYNHKSQLVFKGTEISNDLKKTINTLNIKLDKART